MRDNSYIMQLNLIHQDCEPSFNDKNTEYGEYLMRQLSRAHKEYGRIQIFYDFLGNLIDIFAFTKKVRNIKIANRALDFFVND